MQTFSFLCQYDYPKQHSMGWHVTDPVCAMTKDAHSRYWSVLLDCTLITMSSALKVISEHLSFISSLQCRKPANATKQPAT
eukprot:Em0066g20a